MILNNSFFPTITSSIFLPNFSKYNCINFSKLLEETHLSSGGLYRVLENLIDDGKIQKTNWGRYKIITQTVQ